MLRYISALMFLSFSMTGCALWDSGGEIFRTTFRKPNATDIDTAGNESVRGNTTDGWAGTEFAGLRGDSSSLSSVDSLYSEEGQAIQRRLGDGEP